MFSNHLNTLFLSITHLFSSSAAGDPGVDDGRDGHPSPSMPSKATDSAKK